MVKEAKNLLPPETSLSVLVVDFVDRSLYIQTAAEKETEHWRKSIEDIAFTNTSRLTEQQVKRIIYLKICFESIMIFATLYVGDT